MDEMKKHGIPARQPIVDPTTGKKIDNIFVGTQYIMKLNHPVEKKLSARSTGQYTLDMAPAKGGDASAQSMDPLTIFSMLAHGAKKNLRDAAIYKGERNDEFWRAVQMNEALPPPKPTFAWQKFEAMMRSMGVNVKKEGNMIRPIPVTPDEVLRSSSGEINTPLFVRGKDLKPIQGGLFDPAITGGPRGGRWAHITLHEELPNPTFEKAILSLTNLKEDQFTEIVSGRKFLKPNGELSEDPKDGPTGGKAIKLMLRRVDIDGQIQELEKDIKRLRGSRLNSANRKLRYLKNLKGMGMTPDKA
jgi:hypothetical protein